MKETRISIRVTPEEKKIWEEKSKELGITFTDFVTDAIKIKAGFSKYFRDRLERFSKMMNLPESIVVQNLVISWMARKTAETEVFPEKDVLGEFLFSSDGAITGKNLYDNLYKNFVRDFKLEKEEILKRYPDYTKPAMK